jgi:hypothetical protein
MKIFRTVCFLYLLFWLHKAEAQIVHGSDGRDYIVVNPKLFRGAIGFSQTNLSMDTVARRTADYLYLRIEARVISGFMSKKNKFAIRDAFFLDMGMGELTSTPLTYYGTPEHKLAVHSSFGYEFLAGYRNHDYAAMGGLKLTWNAAIIGSSNMPGKNLYAGYYPLFVRGEYRIGKGEECRLVLMAWDNFKKDKNYAGASIDVPISNKWRFFITAEYRHYTSDAAPANYDNYKYANGKCNLWLLGFKFGTIY